MGGELSLFERFVYDPRGRLIEHHCTGPDLPRDRYGNRIREQLFQLDGLDNLIGCITHFEDDAGEEDDNTDYAEHFYADDDACQVRCITHTHRDYPPQTLFNYDADGNLLNDTDGRSMRYDSQGRLLSVDNPDGSLLCRYRYNAHDHLLGVTRGTDAETLRFYQDNQLRTTVQGDRQHSLLYADDTPLGQQEVGDTQQTLLTLCSESNSVMAELKGRNAVKRTQYTSHGEPSQALDSVLGYNGETREADTGWYLLGSGYRAYDPHLRCFHSPDSESPFGAGGLNPYAYCLGNPISFRDPTGHLPATSHTAMRTYRRELKLAMDKAQRDNAGVVAKWGLIMGIASVAVFTVAFLPLTGFTAGVAAGVLIDLAITGITVGVQYHVDKTNGDQKITDYINYGSNVTILFGFGWGKKAAKTAVTKTAGEAIAGSAEQMRKIAAQMAGIERGAIPTPILGTRTRALSVTALNDANPSAAVASGVIESVTSPPPIKSTRKPRAISPSIKPASLSMSSAGSSSASAPSSSASSAVGSHKSPVASVKAGGAEPQAGTGGEVKINQKTNGDGRSELERFFLVWKDATGTHKIKKAALSVRQPNPSN